MPKGPQAFRTISEAALELGVPQHVLRFWETRFSFIRPMKRAGGRRFYRPQDVAVLRGVRVLLHDQGLSIKDVQRLHREEGLQRLTEAGQVAAQPEAVQTPDEAAASVESPLAPEAEARLQAALAALMAAKARLAQALAAS